MHYSLSKSSIEYFLIYYFQFFLFDFPEKIKSVAGSVDATPQAGEKLRNPSSPRKPKQFETRVVQKTPEKVTDDTDQLNDTEPKTPTKSKTVHKKHTPKKRSSPLKKLDETSNLSGIEPIQQLETEMTELGMDWAASTLRRSQQAQALSSSSSVSGHESSKKNISDVTKPQKPIGLREFLTRELMFRNQQSNSSSNESSLSSQFLKSLMNISGIPSSSSSSSKNSRGSNDVESALFKRTSTPLQERSTTAPTSNKTSSHENSIVAPTQTLHFSGESHISSVKSDQSSDNDKQSSDKNVPLPVPNIKNAEQYASSTSHSE